MRPYRLHPGRALGSGLANGIILVGVPYAIVTFILSVVAQQPAGVRGALAPVVSSLETLRTNALMFGGGATAFAALRALYPKGTPHRAAFGVGRQGLRYAYLAVVLAGGVWSLALPFGGGGGGGGSTVAVMGTLDLSRLFLLLYVAVAVTAAHGIVEFMVYRRTLVLPNMPPQALGADYSVPPPQDDILGPYQPPR